MDWKDIEVGDIISIKVKSRFNPHVLTGEVTNIIHFNRHTDDVCDPLTYYISDDYYLIRLQTIRQNPQQSKEYAITSTFWNLINIQKKGKITMPLEIGKKYKVNIPQNWSNPGQLEFIGELVEIEIKPRKILQYLVYSKELDDKEQGHRGLKESGFGHWWCNPKWLTPVEESTKETIKLEDIFNE